MSTSDWTTLVPVTGEAVALDLRIAQFPSRTLALLLDLVIQGVALFAIFFLMVVPLSEADSASATALSLVILVLVVVGMPTAIETLSRGRSVGKLAAGLRVVRDDGGPVRFRHAFVRALFMVVDFWLSTGAVGLISSLASQRGKRLGDHFAGTVVIRERVPGAARILQHRYTMPPGLEGWAASLDLTRLPDVATLQARQLLARGATLAPAVRESFARQLAAEFTSYVSPPPPPGAPPEAVLAAVLTERMRRSSVAAQEARERAQAARQPLPTASTSTPVVVSATPPSAPPAHPAPQTGPFAPPA